MGKMLCRGILPTLKNTHSQFPRGGYHLPLLRGRICKPLAGSSLRVEEWGRTLRCGAPKAARGSAGKWRREGKKKFEIEPKWNAQKRGEDQPQGLPRTGVTFRVLKSSAETEASAIMPVWPPPTPPVSCASRAWIRAEGSGKREPQVSR